MKTLQSILCASLLVFAACGDDSGDDGNEPAVDAAAAVDAPTPIDPPEPPGNGAVGSNPDTTFNHPTSTADLFDLVDRLQQEGPPFYASRVHGCPKIRYATIGNILASRGVDMQATGETDAGFMWANSDQALGVANYAARNRENSNLTTASAAKLFDIFVQAAPEIIAAMPTLPACTVGGQPTEMFNAGGSCTVDGVSCLIGVPATLAHVSACNTIINQASTPAKGRVIAVAALLAAANTCE